MESVLARLEAVTSRLEAVDTGSRGHHQGASAVPPAGVAGGQAAGSLAAFDALIAGELARTVAAAKAVGGGVASATEALEKAFRLERVVVAAVASCKQPSAPSMQKLLSPVASAIQEVGSKTDGKRTDDFNAFKTLAEASQALSWVAWTPGGGAALPAAQCDEAWSSAEFWANKVLMQYRGKEEKQAAWVGAVKELFVGLKGYVRAHHPTGVAWNPKGGEVSDFKAPAAGAAPPAAPAAAPPRAGAPPPPPPPPPPGGPGSLVKDAPAPGATKAGAMSALFGDINKGEGVASGLRKVTDDMKAKNRADRTGAVPAADAKPGGGGGGGRGASAAPGGPPKFALEGDRKWVVENQVDAKSLVIEGCTFKQTVYVYNCRGCVITVKGKINSIAVDKCSRTGVVFGDVVAAVELVNSSSVEVQATGVVPTIAVDNCAGVQLYLASASLGCAITTAKSSEVNVLIPGASAEDDLVEAAIPEQFVTTYATGGKGGGKWVTEAVQHSAG